MNDKLQSNDPASMAETQNVILIFEINALSIPPISHKKNPIASFFENSILFSIVTQLTSLQMSPTAQTLMQY